MRKWIGVVVALLAGLGILLAPAPTVAAEPPAPPPDLPVHWEEMTAPDFVKAIDRSAGVAVVPLGIIEKHGPHLPLGTDLLNVREVVLRAVAREYAVVFPPYYVGQIFEARHQPGTVAYSERVMFDLLQETTDEIARNGLKKIVLVSGHGGNGSFLPFFGQSQLASRRDYAVYLYQPSERAEDEARLAALRKTEMDMHGGEVETARMLAHRPDLVRLDTARDQSGADQGRLAQLKDAYTGGTGTLAPISGAAGSNAVLTQNTLPIRGVAKICLIDPSCAAFLQLDLPEVTANGTVGAGIGGLLTVGGGTNTIRISVQGAPWTVRTATVVDHIETTNGNTTFTNMTFKGWARGPASATTSTANVNGVLQIVTPVHIQTNLALGTSQKIGGSVAVVLKNVPEPGVLVLLGSAVAGLAVLGRRRMRK